MGIGVAVLTALGAGAGFLTGGLMGALVLGGLALVSSLAVSMFSKTQLPTFNRKPFALSDFQFTQVLEGRPVPLIYGRVKLAVTVLWYGNLVVQAEKQKVKTGKHSHKTVTTGYKYWLDVLGLIGYAGCEGSKLLRVYLNEKPEVLYVGGGQYANKVRSQTLWVFDGYTFFSPARVENRNGQLSIKPLFVPGSGVPLDYRGFILLGFERFYIGENTNILPQLSAEVYVPLGRLSGNLTAGSNENLGVNPVGLVYDLLVNVIKIPRFLIDKNAFEQVAYAKKDYPVSIAITDANKAKDIIDAILQAVGAQLVVTENGISIIDTDSIDLSSVPTLDRSQILTVSFARSTDYIAPSKLKIRVVNNNMHTEILEYENPAIANATKMYKIETLDWTFFQKEVALRRLQVVSEQFTKNTRIITLETLPNDIIKIGNIFRLDIEEYGIKGVYRVIDVKKEFSENKIKYTVKAKEEIREPTAFNPAVYDTSHIISPSTLDIERPKVYAYTIANRLFLYINHTAPAFDIFVKNTNDADYSYLTTTPANSLSGVVTTTGTDEYGEFVEIKFDRLIPFPTENDGSWQLATQNGLLTYTYARQMQSEAIYRFYGVTPHLTQSTITPQKDDVILLGSALTYETEATADEVKVVPRAGAETYDDKAVTLYPVAFEFLHGLLIVNKREAGSDYYVMYPSAVSDEKGFSAGVGAIDGNRAIATNEWQIVIDNETIAVGSKVTSDKILNKTVKIVHTPTKLSKSVYVSSLPTSPFEVLIVS